MKKGFLRFAFVIALFSIFLPIKVSALTFKVEKSVDTAKPGSEVTVYVKASDVTEDSIQGYRPSSATAVSAAMWPAAV